MLDRINTIIEQARGPAALDAASRLLWRAVAAGEVGEADAQRIAEEVQARRGGAGTRSPGTRPLSRSVFPPTRRSPKSPDKIASRLRKRRCASAGAMPPGIAALFAEAERSALSIVTAEVRRHGRCVLPYDAIAARAGVSRSTAKRAIRAAEAAGLIARRVRPQAGRKHLPTVVKIISREWRQWIARGPAVAIADREPDRGPNPDPHGYLLDNQRFDRRRPERTEGPERLGRGRRSGKPPPRATSDR